MEKSDERDYLSNSSDNEINDIESIKVFYLKKGPQTMMFDDINKEIQSFSTEDNENIEDEKKTNKISTIREILTGDFVSSKPSISQYAVHKIIVNRHTLSIWEMKIKKKKHFMIAIIPDIKKISGKESMLLFSIHHDPLYFSWKYRYVLAGLNVNLKDEWKKIEELLSINTKNEINGIEAILKHLELAFSLRQKRIFSTKYDICTDIYNCLKNHNIKCCTDILSVVQIGTRETVTWKS